MKPIYRVLNSKYLHLAALAGVVAAVLQACGGGGNLTNATAIDAGSTKPWELITAGDIAECNPAKPASDTYAYKTGQLVKRLLSAAGSNSNVLTLGDNAYFLGLTIGYTACYAKTWGDFVDKTFTIPGNHDYENNGQNNYYDYFGPKASPGPSFGPDRSGYYRIDQNGWTVLTLNSNIDATAASAQGQWLKAQLATAKPCVAAAWHHAMFSSVERRGNTKMVELYDMLDKANADIVLQSHEHQYERFAPLTSAGAVVAGAGIRSFVVGTGGANVYGFSGAVTGSEKQIETYGVMQLTLSEGKGAWRYVDIYDSVLDQGAFDCKKKS
jgi:acid phosphatase type 7